MTDYRTGTPADWAAVDALFRRSFAATFAHLYAPADLAAFFDRFTPASWRAELADPAMTFDLAEQSGALVGFAKTGPVTLPVAPAGPARELRQLYLDTAAKGTGIGAALMERVLAGVRAAGADELYLSVYVDNHRARRFYERYGLAVIGRYDFLVGSHVDEDQIMRLVL